MQHPMLPGVWGEQPHKSNPPHESILTPFSKRNRLCFIKQFPLDFMPARAEFGIKRPVFTWGHGGDASPHIQRPSTNVRKSCAERTMGVALPLPGRGGGISPHMKAFLRCFLKSSSQGFMPVRASFGMQHPMLPGGVGRAAPQNKHTHFYARKAQFGIKRPAFTRGHGGDASPHIRPHTLQTCGGFYFREGIVWA